MSWLEDALSGAHGVDALDVARSNQELTAQVQTLQNELAEARHMARVSGEVAAMRQAEVESANERHQSIMTALQQLVGGTGAKSD